MQRDPLRRLDVRKVTDVVAKPFGRQDVVSAVAPGQPFLILAVQSDRIQVASERRGFGGQVVNPVVGDAQHRRDFPLSVGQLFQKAFADAVQVQVHVAVPFAADDETVAVGQERDGRPVGMFDVAFVAFVVNDARRAVAVAQ